MASLTDPTFSKYQPYQARQYAQARLSYTPQLYDAVVNHHITTGGQLNVLADIGCGPGNATRDLATSFDNAIGLDPGAEMINTAIESAGLTRNDQPIKYAVCPAENIVHGIRESFPAAKEYGGVDLLTAAMAAHWFDMPKFWAEACHIVKPRGTVALWTSASLYCHPSTPNAAEVQKALFHLERDVLAPYELPSNRISRDLYDNLILPWQTNDEEAANAFPISEFQRLEWDRDGVLSDGKQFFNYSDGKTPDEMERGLGTASMVTRWREANPELVGTERDCVKHAMGQVRLALGVRDGENPKINFGSATVILLFKRK